MDSTEMEWNPFEESDPKPSVEPWPIPDRATMQQRWSFRQVVDRETLEHRRVHKAPPNGGRNIIDVLYDRERHGSSHITTLRHRQRWKQRPLKRTASPATVFDSPVSTTAPPNRYNSASSPLATPILRDSDMEPEDADDPMQEESDSVDASEPAKVPVPSKGAAGILYPQSISRELVRHAERVAALQSTSAFLPHLGGNDELDEEGHRPASSRAVSTISVAFGHDGRTMASTHGDHTVKITCCHTGRLVASLEGHPRTPWTVKYHPTDSNIVASGCLGYQVRVWHWPTRECLQMVRLEFAIISLSFHPAGNLLAIANGTRLHFWGINDYPKKKSDSPSSPSSPRSDRSRMLIEIDQRHMLRCVHFPPGGNSLIIGGVNQTEDLRRRTRGEAGHMSFYLRLWDFDSNVVLGRPSSPGMAMARRAISNVSSAQLTLTALLFRNLTSTSLAAAHFCSESPIVQ